MDKLWIQRGQSCFFAHSRLALFEQLSSQEVTHPCGAIWQKSLAKR
jgi:hypothetical protein